MNDKFRHRPLPVPKGQMPNWALVLCIASGFSPGPLARSVS